KIGYGRAVSNRYSQAEVPRLIGEPNRFEKRFESFINVPGLRTEEAEAVHDLGENVRITAASRELPSFPKKQGSLVLGIAQTSEVNHDLSAHRRSLREVLRCLRKRVQELSCALPVSERLGRIVHPDPLGCPTMPLRCFPSVASVLPVIRYNRRILAELPRLELLDRARDRGMGADSSLREPRTVGD